MRFHYPIKIFSEWLFLRLLQSSQACFLPSTISMFFHSNLQQPNLWRHLFNFMLPLWTNILNANLPLYTALKLFSFQTQLLTGFPQNSYYEICHNIFRLGTCNLIKKELRTLFRSRFDDIHKSLSNKFNFLQILVTFINLSQPQNQSFKELTCFQRSLNQERCK